VISGTRYVYPAGGGGTYRQGPGTTPASTSAPPAARNEIRIGDRVKVSILRRTEHAPQEHIICDGTVFFLGRRWVGVRYRIGAGEFRGGFWPEEVRRA